MSTASPSISTIVRFNPKLALLRTGFRVGAWLQPRRTLERAGNLFSTPLPSTRSRALRASSGGAVEEALDVGGRRIHTYTWGDPASQPWVLLAHGWSSHGTRFLPWIAPLREAGYAVVAFDQPAHGRSEGRRSNLPEFVDTLAAVAGRHGPAAAVLGHSLGGAAVTIAMARGLHANRAVLIAPAADPVAAAQRFARVIGLPMRLCRRMVAMFEAMVGASFDEFQAQRNAPRIGCPALVVHDLCDREVPWEEGERYARFWHGSRLLSTHGLGHNRIVDDPAVISAVLGFLRGEAVGQRVVSTTALPYGIA
ncbi:alpha/beta hydrolase [Luteimonas lutimaris]|uniref:Alpha/beta fold hydrolase n=1 Tax=Luteimonas lutimaris TaxID=698645 RepID=A0ABP7MCL8_9GAMM|nr:alpha/beta fold hydrolase [Luteimonas sp.]